MTFRLPALLAVAALCATAAHADPVRVYAAGSLVAPLKELIAASGLPADAVAAPVFGPSGLLIQRLGSGERQGDLMLSADMPGPGRLAASGKALMPAVPFARNAMCLAAPPKVGLTSDNVLDRMLAPDIRLATSTPLADPGGDYAWAVFARADAIRPGARPMLEGKALKLLGGPDSMLPANGHSAAASIFLADKADMLLYYCSGSAGLLQEMPGFVSVPMPAALEPGPVYGLAVMTANPDALRLALFILSEQGQAILVKNGLLAVLAK